MSDDEALLEKIAGKRGWTVQQYREAKTDERWQAHRMNMHVFGASLMAGMASTREEFVAGEIREEYERELAKKAERQSIERYIRIQNQDQGLDFFLRVKVDTGANCNAITHGLLMDHKLVSRITKLDPPHEIHPAVGKPILCDETITIPWAGKGNETYDEATFYVLRDANVTHRAILGEEWLVKTDLLFDESERHSLEILMAKRQSESEKAAKERARKEAEKDRASSAIAKNDYRNTGGQKDQGSSSKGSSRPNEAGK